MSPGVSLSDLAVHEACFEWTPLKDIPKLVTALVAEKHRDAKVLSAPPQPEREWRAVSLYEAFPKQRTKLRCLLIISSLTFLRTTG